MSNTFYIDKFGSSTHNINEAFMVRTVIFRNKFFNLFIHRFLDSDQESLHDHPWSFWSFLVRGTYTEVVKIAGGVRLIRRQGWKRKLSFRPATDFHRILVDRRYSYEEAPISICFTWKRVKNWHYLVDGQAIKWRKYLGK